MTKSQQLSKNKQKNPKKLTPSEDKKFRECIRDIANDKCQLCTDTGSDIHHPEYGSMGADRNMKCALLVCRPCHNECHRHKHGTLNRTAKRIGDNNWSIHND